MRTPLSYAAESCLTPRLRDLIENGAAANSSDWNGNTPLLYAARGKHHIDMDLPEIRDTIKMLLEKGAKPNVFDKDGESPILILDRRRSNSAGYKYDLKEFEAGKEETKNLLRRYGAEEPRLPTCSATLSQVVAQMTVNLIGIVTNGGMIESRDRQIAAKSSAQLFSGWDLHPTVSSIKLGRNSTIQQEITDFRLAQVRNCGHDNNKAEDRPSKTPPPDDSPSLQISGLGSPKAQGHEKGNVYAGLAPSQRSEDCSYYLHRLAELQHRLFNVNRCLHYLGDHPNDSSETIDDLIARVTGQKYSEVHEASSFYSEHCSDSS